MTSPTPAAAAPAAPAPTPAAPPAPAPDPAAAPPVVPAPAPAPAAPIPTPAQVFAPAPVAAPPQPPAQPAEAPRDISGLPSWAQQEIKGVRDEAARHRIAARTASVNNAVLINAGAYGVNPAALLGSTEWNNRAGQLDPSSPDYPAQLQAAVAATLAACPWVAAQPAGPAATPPPPASGAEFAGGNTAGVPITEAQLAAMTPEQIAQAHAEGRLKHLL